MYLLKTHLNDYNVWVRGINLDPVKKGYLRYDFLLRTEIFSKLNLVISIFPKIVKFSTLYNNYVYGVCFSLWFLSCIHTQNSGLHPRISFTTQTFVIALQRLYYIFRCWLFSRNWSLNLLKLTSWSCFYF